MLLILFKILLLGLVFWPHGRPPCVAQVIPPPAGAGARINSAEPLLGTWTGGFWLAGNWVAVNVRFNRENGVPGGTADVVFPSYEGRLAARNVNLNSLGIDSGRVSFEIPFGDEKIVLRGRVKTRSISGGYEYGGRRGKFGLSLVAVPPLETLEKLYGAYRTAGKTDRVISISRSWGNPQTLDYIEYRTGQTGTLWAISENEFFSGPGRSVSYPVTLKVKFGRDGRLVWREGKTTLVAKKIPFREERIVFKNGETTLGGTLITPAAGGPAANRFPVVVVTPGDYGTNRHQLRVFAHNFVSRGIGAFIFDSRGAGESSGSVGANSFGEMSEDVLAAVRALKKQSHVEAGRIGLFGFSNSAWTITLAASRSSDVGFLIVQSLSGVEPWRQEIFRAETQVRSDGFPEEIVRQTGDFMRLKFEVARTGEGWERLEKIMNQARGARWLAYTNPPRSLERTRQVWQRSMTYDPVPALEKITVPVLALWGEYDTYIPVEASVAIFKKAMSRAGNRDYTITILPRARHGMVEGDSGSPSIGARLKKFPPAFWKTQTDWLIGRVKVFR